MRRTSPYRDARGADSRCDVVPCHRIVWPTTHLGNRRMSMHILKTEQIVSTLSYVTDWLITIEANIEYAQIFESTTTRQKCHQISNKGRDHIRIGCSILRDMCITEYRQMTNVMKYRKRDGNDERKSEFIFLAYLEYTTSESSPLSLSAIA